MTKNGVKTWLDLAEYAHGRALLAARKDDAWLWAHWRELAKWATQQFTETHDGNTLHNVPGVLNWIHGLTNSAESEATGGNFAVAAKLYLRATWLAIILRNSGHTIPESREPSLDWMRKFEPEL
jgi:hypothetical protein